MAEPKVTRIGEGVYRIEHEERSEIVYVAGPRDDPWAFWNGQLFRGRPGGPSPDRRGSAQTDVPQSLTAPMPATVLRVLVQAGTPIKKGDMLVVLEAMKMELPIRAPGDGTVVAVYCREGELVQPDAPLVRVK